MSLVKYLKDVASLSMDTGPIFVGCLLLAIGLSGYFGVFSQPIAEISFLIEPMGFGLYYDQLYWLTLAFVGAWLIIFLWVRPAAISAICPIGFKWAILEGLFCI